MALVAPQDKLQLLAASLKAKDCNQGEGMLIVGGGEIDLMSGSEDDDR